MKKVFMLAALVLGTTTMVNAQEKPAAAKAEVKHAKHVKHAEKKAEKDGVWKDPGEVKLPTEKLKK